jgi:hypothetical protein
MPPPPRIKSNTASHRLPTDVTVRPGASPTELLRLPFTVRTDGSTTLVVVSVRGSFRPRTTVPAGRTDAGRVEIRLRVDGDLVRSSVFLGSPEEAGALGSPEENVGEVFNVALGSPEEHPMAMGSHTLTVEAEVIDPDPEPDEAFHITAAAGGHHATTYAQENA